MTEALLPFAFPFMLKAFAMAAIIAVPAAMLSCFLVLKGWSLMGDAVSHAVLPGIVLAWIFGLPLIVGAFAAGMVTSALTGYISDNARVKRDTVLGVVMSGMFAAGVLLYTSIETNLHLNHILFGNILGVGTADLWTGGVISGVLLVLMLAFWRDLTLFSFDPVQARVAGLPVKALHYGLLAGLSAMVVAMLSAVGIILSVALLIAPGAIAFLLTRRMGTMLATASAISFFSCIGGVYVSFWLDSSPAATIVMILMLFFIAAFIRRARQASQPAPQGEAAPPPPPSRA